ncbi:hypothetical protein RX880_07965 [Pseudomonas syringae pv. actinidiae]|nr:hypothetical protein [Pseudomonas syringae pv. actinidiae]MDU8099210.1 hypothetical protein [Pseudomonas syringae pv. actinidiae]MDU8115734.1 hypothetical protein [Pseudomonas syringae pv. actinidiae]MDU8131830.1 hypothetical protein [Pseudomonas syringae pv. actinidiae]MDU8153140.1 hypothetical protein [Pseudomonas syringae pv. actinidiae]
MKSLNKKIHKIAKISKSEYEILNKIEIKALYRAFDAFKELTPSQEIISYLSKFKTASNKQTVTRLLTDNIMRQFDSEINLSIADFKLDSKVVYFFTDSLLLKALMCKEDLRDIDELKSKMNPRYNVEVIEDNKHLEFYKLLELNLCDFFYRLKAKQSILEKVIEIEDYLTVEDSGLLELFINNIAKDIGLSESDISFALESSDNAFLLADDAGVQFYKNFNSQEIEITIRKIIETIKLEETAPKNEAVHEK